ncbi:hypothetical protein [Enterococcus sp. AZ072]|uniref:hypothetical protein n=1 Tax=unclassified Enterococcus TaxID=2608891 RepID=UPI003D2C3B1C
MDFRMQKKGNKKYLLIVGGLLFSAVLYTQENETVFASEVVSEATVIENSPVYPSAEMETPSSVAENNQETDTKGEEIITPEVPAENVEPSTPPLNEGENDSTEAGAPIEENQSNQNSQEENQEKVPAVNEEQTNQVDTTNNNQPVEKAPEANRQEPVKPVQTPVKVPQQMKAAAQTTEVPTKARAAEQRAVVQDVPVYRIYNPNSGEHFYTMNGYERDMLKGVGWRYEGIGWRSILSGLEVYRLYKPNSGEHFYTMNGNERNMLKGIGWRYEGIGWHTLDSGMPVYRVYNPNGGVGAHHYTVNGNERDNLRNQGWRYEGIGWYSTPFQPESVIQWASGFFGLTRDQIVSELAKHENDRYYLYTPFKGLTGNASTSMSPNGDPNGNGPGMNCTGFIASVIKRAGGNLAAITNVANAWGGVANGYNWRDALTKNVQYETFTSVGSLLQSGLAKKGDILYFEPDYSKPNYDCHLGFFWGNTPNHDRIWHSTFPHNNMSNIKSMTPWTKIYLFRQG